MVILLTTFDSVLLTTVSVDLVASTDLTDLGMVMSDRNIDDQTFTCRKTVVNEYKECFGTLLSLYHVKLEYINGC